MIITEDTGGNTFDMRGGAWTISSPNGNRIEFQIPLYNLDIFTCLSVTCEASECSANAYESIFLEYPTDNGISSMPVSGYWGGTKVKTKSTVTITLSELTPEQLAKAFLVVSNYNYDKNSITGKIYEIIAS